MARGAVTARELRSKLTSDPGVATRALRPDDLWRIRNWAGTRLVPVEEEILRAITADPNNGLGGATLDYAVWCIPDRLGPIGDNMFRLLEQIGEEDYIPQAPIENFLLNTDALHPETLQGDQTPTCPGVYALHGGYAVESVAYHSDPGHQVVGWRSLFLQPIGVAEMPSFVI